MLCPTPCSGLHLCVPSWDVVCPCCYDPSSDPLYISWMIMYFFFFFSASLLSRVWYYMHICDSQTRLVLISILITRIYIILIMSLRCFGSCYDLLYGLKSVLSRFTWLQFSVSQSFCLSICFCAYCPYATGDDDLMSHHPYALMICLDNYPCLYPLFSHMLLCLLSTCFHVHVLS